MTPTETLIPSETPASIAYRTPAPGQSPPYLDEFRMPMVFMPSGVFTMGFAQGEIDERPEHEVSISAFYLDMYEVTNAAYDDCVEARVCSTPRNARIFEDSSRVEHPVVFVTWDQAQTYCAWRGGRLPTEAEWEMAARYAPQSGMTSTRPWGSSGATASRANYSSELTVPVGSYPDGVSAIGAHDMAGNVFEWVLDWYSVDYYARSPYNNPTGPLTGEDRVIRGGSWFYDEYYTRSANRDFSSPTQGRGYIGFRCALPVIDGE